MKGLAPSVMVDGQSVQPEGWMWILGFALGGCDWAIKVATDPTFNMRAKIDDYNRRRGIYFTAQAIECLEKELAKARATMQELMRVSER